MLAKKIAKQAFFAWLILRNFRRKVGNIDEMPVIEVFTDAVATPGSAPHAQGKWESAGKSSAIAKRVCLIDKHANHIEIFS